MTDQIQGPFHRGPFLQCAVLCEQVLIEADGVKSAIRIIDRVNHTVVGPTPPAEMAPFSYTLKMLLKFKSGEARGSHQLRLVMEKPSGETAPPQLQTVLFEGDDDRGVDLNIAFAITFDMPGLYWFDVQIDNDRVTRVPLRIVYVPQVRQIPPSVGRPPPEEEAQ